ncbi:MAG TPA: CapA family protein [Anaerolineae bacterium]|nr:CapA family protein [Anaerolineae bacterium]
MDRRLRHPIGTSAALAALLLSVVGLTAALLTRGETTVTLALTGDIMLGRSVALAHTGGGWEQVLAALAPYASSADLAFANLESPLTDAPLLHAGHDLRAPTQAVQALQAAGFDLVSLANNHALDAGTPGLVDTLGALQEAGIEAVGPGSEALPVRLQGLAIVWLALDDAGSEADTQMAQTNLAAWRNRADLLVVSIHWGVEYQASPSPRQRRLAAELAAAGADLIVGHHAHVLQPVEWILGEGRGRSTLVIFGLGNAIFDQGAPPQARHGATLLVEVGAGGVRSVRAVAHVIEPGRWEAAAAGPAQSSAIASSLTLACDGVRGCR